MKKIAKTTTLILLILLISVSTLKISFADIKPDLSSLKVNEQILKEVNFTGDQIKMVNLGNYIYITDGYNIYKYDIEKNDLPKVANFPFKAVFKTVAAVNKYIYFLGENMVKDSDSYYTDNGYKLSVKNIFRYDTETNKVDEIGELPAGFSAISSAVIDNKIYVFGISKVLIIDTMSNNIKILTLSNTLFNHVAVQFEGKIYLFPLYSTENSIKHNILTFDPKTEQIEEFGYLPELIHLPFYFSTMVINNIFANKSGIFIQFRSDDYNEYLTYNSYNTLILNPKDNTFNITTDIPNRNSEIVIVDNYLYYVGTFTDNYKDHNYLIKYNLSNIKTNMLPKVNFEKNVFNSEIGTSIVANEEKLYLIGGYKGALKNSTFKEDEKDGISINKLPLIKGDFHTYNNDYKIPIDENNYVSDILLYDLQKDTIVKVADMPTGRAYANVAYLNNKIYIIGGKNGDKILNDILEYDPTTNNISYVASLPHEISDYSTIAYDKYIYIIGGKGKITYDKIDTGLIKGTIQNNNSLNDILRFDTNTKNFEKVATLPNGLMNAPVVKINNYIYIIGGILKTEISSGASIDFFDNNVYRFDPKTNKVDKIFEMPKNNYYDLRYYHVSVINGIIYILDDLGEFYRYNPINNDFSKICVLSRLDIVPNSNYNSQITNIGDSIFIVNNMSYNESFSQLYRINPIESNDINSFRDNMLILIQSDGEINFMENGISHGTLSFPNKAKFIDNITFVPLRSVLEFFGIDVNWNEKTQEINITKNNKKIILKVGSNKAKVNDKIVELIKPAQIINGSTYIPIRFVSENIGLNIIWNNNENSVIITDN